MALISFIYLLVGLCGLNSVDRAAGQVDLSPVAASCPSRCLCFKTTVRCMFLQMDEVPRVDPGTTILDLRFNTIRTLPSGIFSTLTQLNTLLLNNNHIRKLESGTFDGLSELKYLYLYKNHLHEIEPEAFTGLDNLEQLFLQHNRLTTLPSGVFNSLTDLRRLRLDSNALICDCQMLWLSDMLREKQGHTQASVTCESPVEIQGLDILDVPNDHFKCRKPEVVVSENDVHVTFGHTLHLSCRAEGDPQPQVYWYKDSNEIISNSVETPGRYTIMEDGTLMIADPQVSDEGVYECVARNAAGEVKADVNVVYSGEPVRPQIIRRPRDWTIVEGETLALECEASGQPHPEIAWTMNDLPLPQDPRFTVEVNGQLQIRNVHVGDRGIYRCTATNTLATVSEFARVEILQLPIFSQRPSDIRAIEGHSAFFSCDATGEPVPSIRWTKDSTPVVNTARIAVNPSGTTLTISQVTPDDQGEYECIAESGAGQRATSAVLTVRQMAPPRVELAPIDQSTPQGATVFFSCRMSGDPPPSITWFHNHVAILEGGRYELPDNHRLVIHQVNTVGDAGIYECVGQNAAGTTRAFAHLVVTDQRINEIDQLFINRTVEDSLARVDNAINNTIRQLRDTSRRRTPQDLLALFRYPSSDALRITRSAEVFERTLQILFEEVHAGNLYNISHDDIHYQDLLTPTQLAIVATLSGCSEHRRIADCEDMCYHHKYRTFDGTCNNLRHPMWGSSLSPMNRLIPPEYENGFNTPKGWDINKRYEGYLLPSARKVSLEIASAPHITEDETYTHMLMQWGQFVDHDIDFVPMAVSNSRFSDGRFCNETCENQAPCFPIPAPEGDARLRGRRCIGVTRSSAMCGSGMTSVFFQTVSMREQINEITSFMDASMIYGSSDEAARNLRDFTSSRGLLRTGIIMPSGKPLLPPNSGEPIDCQMDPNTAHIPCFQAGDVRSNEQLGLLSMHTLWLREHNRIATKMVELNPHWDGDMIYHETRKIVGAMVQHITYSHWLPNILGPKGMEWIGQYTGYDPTVDSTIVNGFATAAFRFGHSLINPVIFRLNETFQPIPEGNLPLHRAFFAPFRVVEEGGIDPILRGMFGRAAKKLTSAEFLNKELTERLFSLAHEVALDLAAINIQRGRDHGLPSYNKYREYCGLAPARRFSDLAQEITDPVLRQKLEEVYGHPENIDVFIGGLSEDLVDGAKIGPTFLCIIAEQFKRIRNGDRFWYENDEVFTPGQLSEIRQSNLARVLCDNGDHIRDVQQDVFLRAVYPGGYLTCDGGHIPMVDLKVWAKCCHDCSRAGDFRSITSLHFRGKRSLEYSYPQDEEIIDDVSTGDETPPDMAKSGMGPVEAGGGDPHSGGGPGDDMMSAMYKMTSNMMDQVDVRIEGMEEVISAMHDTVRKVNRQVRRLRKKLDDQLRLSKTCTDDFQITRHDGEKWRENDCRSCECKSGSMECTSEICQIPVCSRPVKVDGQCCPSCP